MPLHALFFKDYADIPGYTNEHEERISALLARVLPGVDSIFDTATPLHEYIHTAARAVADLITEDPVYDYVAARMYMESLPHVCEFSHEMSLNTARGYAQYIQYLSDNGLAGDDTLALMDAAFLEVTPRLPLLKYAGAVMLYDRYFLRHAGAILEDWALMVFRVACGIGSNVKHVLELIEVMTNLEWLPGTPTLYNAGLTRSQMSSCYLLDSPDDDLNSIYDQYKAVANLSKFAGGVATSFSKVRSRGSNIAGTGGASNGIIPFLKTLDASVASINQGGRRKGACAVYIEPWHADIEEFLEVKDNTGDEARRTHNLNTANWIPDLFMQRVEADADWTLFDPKKVPELHNTWGSEFAAVYMIAESAGLGERVVKARDLYARMMRTLAETGNGWMCFKDRANEHCAQVTKTNGKMVHSSNLCTEILEVTDKGNTAVCNLGSLNASKFITTDNHIDVARVRQVVTTVVEAMDNVIDRNFYPTEEAKRSNMKWRPIGLGLMGLADFFYKLKLPFDSGIAKHHSTLLQKTIYNAAVFASEQLAKSRGVFPAFNESRYPEGWSHDSGYKDGIIRRLRNSLLIAIAPTASIATLAGCGPSTDKDSSNLYKRANLSGEFVIINHWLVNELKPLGLWTSRIRLALSDANGSVQGISEIPPDIRERYKTAWETSNKAIIDLAAARQPYIDQSQSLNLFVEDPTLDSLSSMYMYAWKKGVKTTYYLRSRGATAIRKVVNGGSAFKSEEALMCSLENPESCEACQ